MSGSEPGPPTSWACAIEEGAGHLSGQIAGLSRCFIELCKLKVADAIFALEAYLWNQWSAERARFRAVLLPLRHRPRHSKFPDCCRRSVAIFRSSGPSRQRQLENLCRGRRTESKNVRFRYYWKALIVTDKQRRVDFERVESGSLMKFRTGMGSRKSFG